MNFMRNKILTTYLFYALATFASSQFGAAQTNLSNSEVRKALETEVASKKNDVRKLVSAMGTEEALKYTLPMMVKQVKQTMPQIPDYYWREVLKEINYEEMIEIIIPIYDKHFTHEDIKELLHHYESPIVKKQISLIPSISEELIQAGNDWGKQLVARAQIAFPNTNTAIAPQSAPEHISQETKDYSLRVAGYDPSLFDLSDTGVVTPKVKEQTKTPASEPIPKEIKYWISAQDGSGTAFEYASKAEPKPYGNGYKFLMYPNNTEIVVSGNVTIRKIR